MIGIERGVIFANNASLTSGKKHTFTDYGSYISSKSIGMPKPQTYTVSIAGRDGVVDLTEKLYGNTPRYGNRLIQINLLIPDGDAKWAAALSKFSNDLHGRLKYFGFDDDPNWAFHGRITVDKFQTQRHKGIISLKADCGPYKLERNLATDTVMVDGKYVSPWLWDPFSFVDGKIEQNVVTISGSGTMTFSTGGRIVPVMLKATSAMSATVGGKSINITTEWKEFEFSSTSVTLNITGTGTVFAAWRGESL